MLYVELWSWDERFVAGFFSADFRFIDSFLYLMARALVFIIPGAWKKERDREEGDGLLIYSLV